MNKRNKKLVRTKSCQIYDVASQSIILVYRLRIYSAGEKQTFLIVC